jgi:hypothetical protein
MACDNLFDSWDTSHYNASITLNSSGNSAGQAINVSSARNLCKVEFYLRSYIGSNSKTIEARLYACSGTPGTDGIPTSTVLASSSELVINSFFAYQIISFDISYNLIANTNYCVGLWCTASGTSSIIRVGADITNSHPGNAFRNGAAVTRDAIFYLYSDEAGGEWTGTINGIVNPSHINGIPVSNISKVNGQ